MQRTPRIIDKRTSPIHAHLKRAQRERCAKVGTLMKEDRIIGTMNATNERQQFFKKKVGCKDT